MAHPIVTTNKGLVRGERRDDLSVFRNVPFAAPPVGERRFRPPAPVEPWTGERDTTAFGPIPPQVADPMSALLGLIGDAPQDEDCLTLNVWTPDCDAEGRAVMVWIHGGAFATGTGASPVYDGSALARRGNVVVVTLNYRVGALGFLAANWGLLDQCAALEWVRSEIARFGGDPERVTVFGESAGAGSISALLSMPRARGLFRRAIIQSAAPGGMVTKGESERRARLVLDRLGEANAGPGLSEPLLGRLRKLPLERLLAAQTACLQEERFAEGMMFMPVIDGDTLPRTPLESTRDGEVPPVDLIIGTTSEELRLYALDPQTASLDEAGLEKRLAHLGTARGPVLETYRSARAERGDSVAPPELFSAIEGDRAMRVPSCELAATHAANGARAWMYLFTWRSPMYGGVMGACHALDLPFTFGTLGVASMPEFAGTGPEVREISDRMIEAWTRFACDGDPGWPGYEATSRVTMEFGEKSGPLEAPLERERAVWDTLEKGTS